MRLFCELLPSFFIGCAMSHHATDSQATLPDDFMVYYHWRAGTKLPLDHYEYTITIAPSSQSEIVLIPDYPRVAVPKWAEQFHVEEPNLHALYRVMVENGLFTRR